MDGVTDPVKKRGGVMTEKQERAIKFIERELEIKYTGTSDSDASRFIGANLDRAKKCSYFESQMTIDVFGASFGEKREIKLDLKRDLSRELLIRDTQRKISGTECMANFAENIFLENTNFAQESEE